MQVQTNSSSSFYNPYTSPSPQETQTQSNTVQDQLKVDFVTIASLLSSSEKRLYNSLMYTQDYEGAKDIIAIGFIRATALEKTDTTQRMLDIKV